MADENHNYVKIFQIFRCDYFEDWFLLSVGMVTGKKQLAQLKNLTPRLISLKLWEDSNVAPTKKLMTSFKKLLRKSCWG